MRRWRKIAAVALAWSLLCRQGLFVSEAVAQVRTQVRATPAAPVVPVVAAPATLRAPTLSGLALPLLPALSAPALTLPQATVKPAAAAVAAVAATPAAAPAPVAAAVRSASLPQARPEAAAAERPVARALESFEGAVAKDRGAAAPALSLHFDGARRGAANAVSAPEPGPSRPSRSGLRPAAKRSFVEFNAQYLRDVKKHFLESATKPNKQDYWFLATKTFGLNLAVRVAFAAKGVAAGDLSVLRAVLSTSWYQLQDAFFTVFGQTYMKFLGKMTGMLRIGNAKVGDLLFVYTQLVVSEFLNRLVLGPIGENPLVYTWSGMGLLFLNNLQGMISGGLLVPVINKLRAAGYISEKTSNWLYQAASLTMHLGLLATFGYQTLFTVLTTALMVLSWGAYIGLSFFAKGKAGPEKPL